MKSSLIKALSESTQPAANYAWHEFNREFGITDMVEFLEDYMGLTIFNLDTFYTTYEKPLDLIETYPNRILKALHDFSDMEYKEIIYRLKETI